MDTHPTKINVPNFIYAKKRKEKKCIKVHMRIKFGHRYPKVFCLFTTNGDILYFSRNFVKREFLTLARLTLRYHVNIPAISSCKQISNIKYQHKEVSSCEVLCGGKGRCSDPDQPCNSKLAGPGKGPMCQQGS